MPGQKNLIRSDEFGWVVDQMEPGCDELKRIKKVPGTWSRNSNSDSALVRNP